MLSRRLAISMCFAGLLVSNGRAGEDLVVPADEAAQHEGERCTVEMVVKSARPLRTKQGTLILLNSANNPRAPENVAVVFDEAAAGKFASAGIRGIEAYYTHKQIRVTETIQRKNGALEMRVREPSQIQIVDANPPPDPREIPPPPENQSDDFDPRPQSYLMYYFLGGGAILLIVGLLVRRRMKAKKEE